MTTPRFEDTLVAPGTKCDEVVYRRTSFRGGQCSRDATVREARVEHIGYGPNREEVTYLKNFCTQHSATAKERKRARRIAEAESRNRVATYRAVHAEMGVLAVQLLRAQGLLPDSNAGTVESVIAERDTIKRLLQAEQC